MTSLLEALHAGRPRAVAQAISLVEGGGRPAAELLAGLDEKRIDAALVVGVTGPPGVGKSTLTNGLIAQLRQRHLRVGVIGVDPSSPLTGGALLGDRIRMMEHALDPDVLMRSMASRGQLGGLSPATSGTARIMAAAGCRVILVETVGVGQSEAEIATVADITLLVLAPGFGDDIQAMKAGILEIADFLVINKNDLPGADRLALDLQATLPASRQDARQLMRTVARTGQGLNSLTERILALEQQRRQQAAWSRHRRRARQGELAEQIISALRPMLTDHLEKKGKEISAQRVRELIQCLQTCLQRRT